MNKELVFKILAIIGLCILISPIYTAVLFLIIWLVRKVLSTTPATK